MASWSLSPTASHSIQSIVQFYASEASAEIGDEILHRILEFIETIAAHPRAFRDDGDGVCTAVVPRLRHRVAYHYDADANHVDVLGVLHARRAC